LIEKAAERRENFLISARLCRSLPQMYGPAAFRKRDGADAFAPKEGPTAETTAALYRAKHMLGIVGRPAEALGVEPAELLRSRECKRPDRAG
jgi:hypothetical protein